MILNLFSTGCKAPEKFSIGPDIFFGKEVSFKNWPEPKLSRLPA